jgi:glycerol kinase
VPHRKYTSGAVAPAVLALDQGTTGSTALVVAVDGTLLGHGYREIAQHFPEPGWVEHDPEEIFQATLSAAREALHQAHVIPAAIGITNQRETVCSWERDTGQPIHRAIVWQDRRTSDRCAALTAEGHAARIREKTGLVIDPYFSATKIEWLMEHVPGLPSRVASGEAVFGTVDSWLIYRLTAGKSFVTDHTNASRTMLYNLHSRYWDADLLALFGVPVEALPAIMPSSGIIGTAAPEHLGNEIPIAGLAGDQQAALFGQGCWDQGTAKNTYGTGAFLLLNTGGTPVPSKAGLLTTSACGRRGEPVYALEGSVFIAGAAIQWLRDGLRLVDHASKTAALASEVSDTGGVYFVPALVGLGAPYWEPRARGTIVGLTRGTTRAHLVRATLEAIAYSVKDVLDAMIADSGLELSGLQIDGGAAANDWLSQFQADLLNVPVSRPDVLETTAFGAAGLAGLGVGLWKEPEDILEGRKFRRFEPRPEGARARAAHVAWKQAVDAALFWAKAGSREP